MASLNLEPFLFKEPLSPIFHFRLNLVVFKLWPPFYWYSLYTPIICHAQGKHPLDISPPMVLSRDTSKTSLNK